MANTWYKNRSSLLVMFWFVTRACQTHELLVQKGMQLYIHMSHAIYHNEDLVQVNYKEASRKQRSGISVFREFRARSKRV